MNDKNGGPAFPQGADFNAHGDYHHVGHHGGMTLRDYFAAAAVQGILHYFPSVSREITGDDDARKSRIAADAYRIADAMLAARGSND